MMEDKKIRTPLVSVLKRDKLPTYKAIIIRIATFIFTFLLSMLFCFFIIKENYFEIIGTLFSGALIRPWRLIMDACLLLANNIRIINNVLFIELFVAKLFR